MVNVLSEIQASFDSGKEITVYIQFGTVQGSFVVSKIDQMDEASDWIFYGGNFKLSTGRYLFNRKDEENGVVRYIFSPKMERHPKKLICFQVK